MTLNALPTTSPYPPQLGLLLFAHGARDPRWALPFIEVQSQLRASRPEMAVALAYLEFMAPDLLGAGQQLVEAGCQTVRVVPLFLGAGGHVRKDLPALMAQLRGAHPQVQWELQTAIGERASVVAALAQAALEAAPAPSEPLA